MSVARPTFVVLLLLAILDPQPARAQWVPPTPAGCPGAREDPDEQRALARALFEDGTRRGEARGAYAEAAALFACCYVVRPHPNVLYNLGLSAEAAGDLLTARAALERYLGEVADAPDRPNAEAVLESVRERIAALPPLLLTPAGPPIPSAAPDEPAEGDAYPETEDVASPAMQVAGWTLIGIGVGAAAAGGTTLAVVAAAEAAAANDPPPDTPWPEVLEHRDRHDTYVAAEIAVFAVAGALVAGGVALLVIDAFGEDSAATAMPVVGSDAAGMVLVWRF